MLATVFVTALLATPRTATDLAESLAALAIRADGTYVAASLGNWMLSAGYLDRWWGPGWQGSLILSSNARPMLSIAADRNESTPFDLPVLRWLFEHSEAWNLIRNRLSSLVQRRLMQQQGLVSYEDGSPEAVARQLAAAQREFPDLGAAGEAAAGGPLAVVQDGDLIVLTVGEPMGQAGGTNTLKIVRVGEHA